DDESRARGAPPPSAGQWGLSRGQGDSRTRDTLAGDPDADVARDLRGLLLRVVPVGLLDVAADLPLRRARLRAERHGDHGHGAADGGGELRPAPEGPRRRPPA